jgi:PAS domain S-box-containing protein
MHFDFDGRILQANDAFLHIVGYHRDDIGSGQLRWRDLTPPEWNGADDRAVVEVAATGTCRRYEKEYFRRDNSRVPVLIAGANSDELRRQGVAFALDLTERKRVEAELVHANRVATMGQLAASIAHEVNPPRTSLAAHSFPMLPIGRNSLWKKTGNFIVGFYRFHLLQAVLPHRP